MNCSVNFNFRFLRLLLLTSLFFSAVLIGRAASTDPQMIKERVMAGLLTLDVPDSQVNDLINNQREDGTWPGINYNDVSRTAFEHSNHTSNMVVLSRAYAKKGSGFSKNKKVLSAIEAALAHWVKEDYFSDNWWHNQIGTPNNLVTVMLLAGEDLDAELTGKAQPIIGRAHLDASGARPSGDRIKIAGILAKNLLFIGDYKRFEEVIQVIEGEIKFSTERGLQYDNSFHHRVDRVNNTLSYGLGYADAFTEWAGYVTGTDYAFSQKKIQLLVDYYLDGICKTMVYGKYPDPGAKNRSVARPGSLKPMSAGTPKKLIQTTDYRKEELEKIIRIREGQLDGNVLSHSTFFWQSEHFTFQRPHFYTSVRMYSTRNDNMEVPYNSEGLKNHHRGDGANHVLLTGKEYDDLFPVMDYQKIPGTTVLQKETLPNEDQIQKTGLTDFVGAVTDGLYGAVAFDFKSPHDPLQARKSWFFFDEEYVCLGAGITAGSEQHVCTTLNQNLLEGAVTLSTSSGEETAPIGTSELKEVNWIHNNRMAYFFAEPKTIHLSTGPVSGYWTAINQQTSAPKEKVTLDVFKLWMDHGARPKEESYAYVVLPGVGVKEAKAYDLKGNLDILSNTSDIQAVLHKNLEIYQMVFYRAGKLDLGNGFFIEMDAPGQVMIQTDGKTIKKITVADPARKLLKMHFRLSSAIDQTSEGFTSVWDERKGNSEVVVDLPQTVYAGKSVTVEL